MFGFSSQKELEHTDDSTSFEIKLSFQDGPVAKPQCQPGRQGNERRSSPKQKTKDTELEAENAGRPNPPAVRHR